MATTINLGFAGCGGIAKNTLIPQAAALPEFRLRAFMDIDGEKAKAVCESVGGAYHTTDLSRLLDDAELDAVAVCTLPDTHAALAQAVLEHGKHVFIQKPVATTYEECRGLLRAERNSSAKAMAAYCYRLSPLVAEIRKTIERPRLLYARMMNADLVRSHAHYLKIPALSGLGPMLELACHNVDMVYWLARSKPVRVFASGGNMLHPGVNVLDNFAMTIEFENGAVAVLNSGDSGGGDFRYKWHAEVFGNDTAAIIDGFRTLTFSGKRKETIESEYQSGIGLDRDMAVFRDVLVGKIPSPAPVAEGIVASIVMLKAEESLKSGQPVAIALDEYCR